MKKFNMALTLGISLITASILVGCGGGSSTGGNGNGAGGMGNGGTDAAADGSNIPYLRDNHANYTEHGSTQTPAPVKDANAKSINWTIAATTEEGAVKLQEHLAFMEEQLKTDQNPRPWDKLFLMEAYMKFNGYYTTSVEKSGTNIVVSKSANSACAYEVISAHSDAVSGDFFGKGDIMIDNSTTAERILASASCDAERSVVESYISARLKTRGQ